MSEIAIKHVFEKPKQYKDTDVVLRGWVVSNRATIKSDF